MSYEIKERVEDPNLHQAVNRICNWIVTGNPEGIWYRRQMEKSIEKELINESNRITQNND